MNKKKTFKSFKLSDCDYVEPASYFPKEYLDELKERAKKGKTEKKKTAKKGKNAK